MTAVDAFSIEEWEDRYSNGEVPTRPALLRGIASDWPIVVAERQNSKASRPILRSVAGPAPVDVMVGEPEIAGRFFYSDDMRGFNFMLASMPLSEVIEQIEAVENSVRPKSIYAGAAPVARHAPGFAEMHHFPIATPDATPKIWVGNAVQIATHYDLSDNFAVVAVGRRRFSLFPPDATPDLYVGPLGFTIAGQPVSMVDPLKPDLDHYPRYVRALDKMLVADLEPGDAIFIPTLWWHHVQSFDTFNVLVNYWHNHPPQGQPFTALVHAMLGIRDLPATQRAAWMTWFEHFVFSDEATNAASHLPLHARSVQAPASAERTAAIRHYLMSRLSRD